MIRGVEKGAKGSLLLRSPGEVLSTDYLQPKAMPLARFARRTGIPMTMLRQITLGTRYIDAEQALRLSLVMEPTAAYWLLQVRHDLAIAGAHLPAPRSSTLRATLHIFARVY